MRKKNSKKALSWHLALQIVLRNVYLVTFAAITWEIYAQAFRSSITKLESLWCEVLNATSQKFRQLSCSLTINQTHMFFMMYLNLFYGRGLVVLHSWRWLSITRIQFHHSENTDSTLTLHDESSSKPFMAGHDGGNIVFDNTREVRYAVIIVLHNKEVSSRSNANFWLCIQWLAHAHPLCSRGSSQTSAWPEVSASCQEFNIDLQNFFVGRNAISRVTDSTSATFGHNSPLWNDLHTATNSALEKTYLVPQCSLERY